MEATGRTVEEATVVALEHLGVGQQDAEVQVLAEPKVGLFGRVRREARVRARVRPSPVRAKVEERRRPAERTRRRRRSSAGTGELTPSTSESAGTPAAELAEAQIGTSRPIDGSSARRTRKDDSPEGPSAYSGEDDGEDDGMMDEEATLAAQGAVGAAFIEGVLERFNMAATVNSSELDERTVELQVHGDGLGVLIGRGGATLLALQELTRTVVQRQTRAYGRLVVDVGGYRERRREALEEFVRSLVEEVRATGNERVLEPMNSSDRKIVHDLVNGLSGVVTRSEGEEPRRRVVIFRQREE